MLLMNEPKSKPINRDGRWTKKLYYLLPLSLSLSVFKPYFISWLGCLGNETMMNRKRKIN